MLRTRVIPVLLLRNKGLVKTVKFGKSTYIGDPINAVKLFNDKGVDELVFLDIDASKEKRGPNFELIKNIATECFMPLGYGGGISTLEDIKQLFSIGVEKVILNAAALKDTQLISKAAQIFGGQSIVVSIDVNKNLFGKYLVYSHSKTVHNKTNLLDYIKEVESAGAGELIINAVDKDGVMEGYDLKLIEQVAQAVSVPVVACGGAGTVLDFKKAVIAGASGVAAGSVFIYHGPHRAVLINYPTQEELKKILA
jgi:cyclase